MIALDTNLLVYAHREDSPHHDKARQVLSEVVAERAQWAIPWPCLHEFLAIVTHRRIYQPPTEIPLALEAMTSLLNLPHVQLLTETADHGSILEGLLLRSRGVRGPKVHDARIAAICLGHGVRALWSADRDFSWFPDLAVVNPLAD